MSDHPLIRIADTEPNYRARLVQNLYGAHQPSWMERAACSESTTKGAESYFDDEVKDGAEHFPDTTYPAMETCRDCPVRRPCLEQAYEYEWHLQAIKGTAPVRYEWVEDGARFGIWGGVPGRIRERFAADPDRLDRCEEWFEQTAETLRFGLQDIVDDLWDRSLDPRLKMVAPTDEGA